MRWIPFRYRFYITSAKVPYLIFKYSLNSYRLWLRFDVLTLTGSVKQVWAFLSIFRQSKRTQSSVLWFLIQRLVKKSQRRLWKLLWICPQDKDTMWRVSATLKPMKPRWGVSTAKRQREESGQVWSEWQMEWDLTSGTWSRFSGAENIELDPADVRDN